LTATQEILKEKNAFGYFEIRMESIGGQGANLAGKILADAGIMHLGLNGVSFASYGSEKKGTPVKAFIKFAETDKNISVNSPVVEPNLLVVFHTILAKNVPIMQGVKAGAKVIVNTPMSCAEVRDLLKVPGGVKLLCLDALKISVEEKVRINTTILGAVPRAVEFITKDAMHAAIREMFVHKYPKLVEPNLKAFERGFEEVEIMDVPDDGKYPLIEVRHFRPALGWKNAPIGGMIVNPGNTVLNDMSASRSGFIPVFHPENCINCAECDTTCPDQCFIWETVTDAKGKMMRFNRGIKQQYCKGCMRCVEICPKQALTAERE